ncbi:MAG: MFS transporter, partial [Actinomycetes bacterium]
VYGGFAGVTDGVGKAWISGLAPPEVRGHAQGLLQGLSGAAILVAGVWAGLAWESGQGSGHLPLLVSGVITAAAAVGLFAVGSRLE